MTIVEYEYFDEFRSALVSNPNKIFVLDFYATWCSPCKRIKPFYEKLAEDYEEFIFCEIDVDNEEYNEFCEELQIKAMPTFIIYNYEKGVLNRLSGANEEKLMNMIKNI